MEAFWQGYARPHQVLSALIFWCLQEHIVLYCYSQPVCRPIFPSEGHSNLVTDEGMLGTSAFLGPWFFAF